MRGEGPVDPDAERIQGDPVFHALDISQVDLAKDCAIFAEAVEEVIRGGVDTCDESFYMRALEKRSVLTDNFTMERSGESGSQMELTTKFTFASS